MSINDVDRKKIIDYYFQDPNTKAVLEATDVNATRAEVGELLDAIYQHLVSVFTPTRMHKLTWDGKQWIAPCGCAYHPDDDNMSHGGAPHVHRCEVHLPDLFSKSHLQQLYIESKDDEDFVNEIKLLIDAERLA